MGRISYEGKLDPQMVAALKKQEELAPGIGEMHKMPIHELRRSYNLERRYWNEGAPDLARVHNATVAGPVGDIPVRFYFPTNDCPSPTLIYLHGGGFVVGNLDTHDRIMRLLALRSGIAIVGIDYSLAPEHKFPIALEETMAVIKYLRDHGNQVGINEDRMAIGGDSAGANMSVAISLMLRPDYPHLLKLLLLFYGAYGLRDSGSRRFYGGPEDGMGEEDLAYYQGCYLRKKEDVDDPRFDVLRADLTGLPPMFIIAAEFDPLLDDSITLKTLADEDRVPSKLKIYKGVLHGFLHLSRMVDKADQAIHDASAALRNMLLYDGIHQS